MRVIWVLRNIKDSKNQG